MNCFEQRLTERDGYHNKTCFVRQEANQDVAIETPMIPCKCSPKSILYNYLISNWILCPVLSPLQGFPIGI